MHRVKQRERERDTNSYVLFKITTVTTIATTPTKGYKVTLCSD